VKSKNLGSLAAASAVLAVALVTATQFTDALGDVRQRVGDVLLGGGSPSRAALQAGPCPTPAASAAARAYGLALTDPMTLATFVRDNAPFFAESGDAVECYRRLAAALVANNDLGQVDALRDRAEAERETGLRFDRAAYASDLAETLQELSGALPALARADDGRYRGTKAYDSAQAYSTLLRRAPGASASIDALIRADEAVLRELAKRLNGGA
jgi:hypothetical protein